MAYIKKNKILTVIMNGNKIFIEKLLFKNKTFSGIIGYSKIGEFMLGGEM